MPSEIQDHGCPLSRMEPTVKVAFAAAVTPELPTTIAACSCSWLPSVAQCTHNLLNKLAVQSMALFWVLGGRVQSSDIAYSDL